MIPDKTFASVEPFQATIGGVEALVPEATFVDARGMGQKAVLRDQVQAWLTEISGHVLLRVSRYTDLKRDDMQAMVATAARDIVHHGAASYAEAARFPERADKTDASYANVLWTRYQQMLESLVQQLDVWLADPDLVNGGTSTASAAFSFPPARITDNLGF